MYMSFDFQPLYAGVVSLCEDTEFTVIFHRKDTLAAAKGNDDLSNFTEAGDCRACTSRKIFTKLCEKLCESIITPTVIITPGDLL